MTWASPSGEASQIAADLGVIAGTVPSVGDSRISPAVVEDFRELGTTFQVANAAASPIVVSFTDASFAAFGSYGVAGGGLKLSPAIGVIAASFASSGAETGTSSGQGGLGAAAAADRPYPAADFPGISQLPHPIFKQDGKPLLLVDLKNNEVTDPEAEVVAFLSYRSDLGADAKFRGTLYYHAAADAASKWTPCPAAVITTTPLTGLRVFVRLAVRPKDSSQGKVLAQRTAGIGAAGRNKVFQVQSWRVPIASTDDPLGGSTYAQGISDDTNDGVNREMLFLDAAASSALPIDGQEQCPIWSNFVTLTYVGRAETAPGSTLAVVLKSWCKGLEGGAWTGLQHSAFSCPSGTEVKQYWSTGPIALASLGLTRGQLFSLGLSRQPADAGDTLGATLSMSAVIVDWS